MFGGVWMLQFGGGEEVRACASKRACAERKKLVPNARAGIVTAVFFFPILVNVLFISHQAVLNEKREGHDGRKGDSAEASHGA